MNHSTLLYDEPPIALSPTLARTIGLPEAVFLQQLHYWLAHKARDPARYKDYFIGGRPWVKWTQEELMQQVPLGRSTEPHKRVIRVLKELNILQVEQHLRTNWNQSNFYTLNYAALQEYLDQRLSRQSSPVNNADPVVEKTTLDKRIRTAPMVGEPADHCSETTHKKNIQKATTTRRDLVLDELPAKLHEEVARLVPSGTLGQDFIDLLVARIKRDKQLPAEQQLQYPLSWLKTMLKQSDLDFTPARKVSAEREHRSKTKHQVEISTTTPKVDKAPITERLASAMLFIGKATHEQRKQLIRDYFTTNPGRQIRSKVEASITNGTQPEGRYVQELFCSIVETARGAQNASDA